MNYRYSPAADSFYRVGLDYKNFPADLIDVSADLFEEAVKARGLGATLSVEAGHLVIVPPYHPTPEELQAQAVQAVRAAAQSAVQEVIDAAYQSKGYDGSASLAKYLAYADAQIAALPAAEQPLIKAFRAECRALQAWEPRCWAGLVLYSQSVASGTTPAPTTIEEARAAAVAALPALVWEAV